MIPLRLIEFILRSIYPGLSNGGRSVKIARVTIREIIFEEDGIPEMHLRRCHPL
jgi:hypothetical protein